MLKYDDYDMTGDTREFSTRGLELGNTVSISSAHPGRKRSHSNASVIHENPSTSYESQTTGVKRQLDQAMGAEFGWNPAKSSPGLAAGEVHSGTVAATGSAPRHQSWHSETVNPNANLAAYADDDLESVRMSHDVPRHDNVHEGHEEEDDSRALLAPDGSHHDDTAEIPASGHRYSDHPHTSGLGP